MFQIVLQGHSLCPPCIPAHSQQVASNVLTIISALWDGKTTRTITWVWPGRDSHYCSSHSIGQNFSMRPPKTGKEAAKFSLGLNGPFPWKEERGFCDERESLCPSPISPCPYSFITHWPSSQSFPDGHFIYQTHS